MSHWTKTTTPTAEQKATSDAPDGFVDGQEYIDALTASAAAAGVESLALTRTAILEELEAATSFEDLKRRLRARYRTLDPEPIVDVAQRATVLAALAGDHAVQQDMG